MKRLALCGIAAMIIPSVGAPAVARTPSAARVSKDVTNYWNEHWPKKEVAHVSSKSEQCAEGELDVKGRRGKMKRVKTCLLEVDVFIARGYRFLIFRGTEVHYKGNKLLSVQLGELQKAWKAGGVPAPAQERAAKMLSAQAAELLGSDPKVTIVEMGIPRPYGEFYRMTVVVDVSYTTDGNPVKRESVLATFESDGNDWRPVSDLLF